MSVAAIVLAAGRGTRFGPEPKLLATLAGKPLVRHVAEAALGSRARPVVVVTGHCGSEVEASLADLSLIQVRNPSYAEGLCTSLKAGFMALPPDADAAVVLLADMPGIGAPLIDSLITAWERDRPAALVPAHAGQRGNPVVVSAALRPEVETLQGDQGLGPILRQHPDVRLFPVDDPAVLQDVDSTQALAALRS